DHTATGVLGNPGRNQIAPPGDRRRAPAARAFPRLQPMTGGDRRSRRQGLLLLAPALTILVVLTAYPGLYVLWLSLQHRVPIFGTTEFIGLGHYVFLAQAPRFWSAARTTGLFTVFSVLVEVVLGVLLALVLRAQRRGRWLAFSLLLLAWAMPAVVTAKLFEWLYHPSSGPINVL